MDIFDRLFLVTMSPTSTVWEIAGAITLSSPLRNTRKRPISRLGSPYLHCLEELPHLTGLPIATILQTLEENWNFFHISYGCYLGGDSSVFQIYLPHCHETFLKDKVRSRGLYATYLNCVIHALKYGITHVKNLKSVKV